MCESSYPQYNRERPTRFSVEGYEVPWEVMTETIRSMTSHVSVRGYKPDPLPDGALEALLVAGISAPTSSNMHSYSIITVTDPEKKRKLAELCGDQKHIEECPVFLVFCPDIYRLKHVTARQGYKFAANYLEMFLVAAVDAALVCQNVAVAAESLGLGTVMIGAIRNNPHAVNELLGLPPGVFALVGLCVGYPKDEYPAIKPRLPLDVLVHEEQYNTDVEALDEGLDRYDDIMLQTGIYAGRQVQLEGAREDRPYSWCEHTARRLARVNRRRERLLDILNDLGFDIR